MTPKSSPQWLLCEMGQVPYQIAHRAQLGLVEARHAGRIKQDLLLLLEHPAVFTIGKRGCREHLLVDEAQLRSRGIDIIQVERGGDITFHGPGQLVGYLIVDLKSRGLDIGRFVRMIEDVMIRASADFMVIAERDARNPGVWAGGRKMGSIGLAVRHGISFHGFAINVANNLEPFSWINPCGLKTVSMTTLSLEMKSDAEIGAVRKRIAFHLADLFGVEFSGINEETILAPDLPLIQLF